MYGPVHVIRDVAGGLGDRGGCRRGRPSLDPAEELVAGAVVVVVVGRRHRRRLGVHHLSDVHYIPFIK